MFAFRETVNLRLASVNLLYWAGVYVFLPILPLYYAKIGLPGESIGFAIGAYSFGAALSRIPAGKLSDTLGCPILIYFGIVLSLIAVGGYFLAGTLTAIVGVRLLHGIASAAYSSSSSSYITLINEPSRAKDVFALYTLASMIGISTFTAAGGWIYEHGEFWLTAMTSVLLTCVSLFIFPKQIQPVKKNLVEGARKPILEVVANRSIYNPSLNQLIIYLAFGSLMVFLPLLSIRHGMNDKLWVYYACYSISIAVSRIFISRICQLLSVKAILVLIFLLLICSLIVPAMALSVFTLAVAGFGAGIATGLGTPILASQVVAGSEAKNRGVALGFFSTTIDLGMLIGSTFMGVVAKFFGYELMFCFVAVIVFLNLVLYLSQKNS